MGAAVWTGVYSWGRGIDAVYTHVRLCSSGAGCIATVWTGGIQRRIVSIFWENVRVILHTVKCLLIAAIHTCAYTTLRAVRPAPYISIKNT